MSGTARKQGRRLLIIFILSICFSRIKQKLIQVFPLIILIGFSQILFLLIKTIVMCSIRNIFCNSFNTMLHMKLCGSHKMRICEGYQLKLRDDIHCACSSSENTLYFMNKKNTFILFHPLNLHHGIPSILCLHLCEQFGKKPTTVVHLTNVQTTLAYFNCDDKKCDKILCKYIRTQRRERNPMLGSPNLIQISLMLLCIGYILHITLQHILKAFMASE